MTDFSRYLIASDLDGTFFDKTAHPASANLKALARYRAGGGLFTIATGRVYHALPLTIPGIDKMLNAPAVLCNGTYLYDFATNTSYHEQCFSPELAKELMHFVETSFPDVPIIGCAREGLYYANPGEDLLQYIQTHNPEFRHACPMREWPTIHWHKLVMTLDAKRAPLCRKQIQNHFGVRLGITTSSPPILELQLPNISKATGLAQLHHLSEKTRGRLLIACGDYENDLEMLRAADIAVCPANACDAVKEIADYVLCDHNEGVIADLIAQLEAGRITPKKEAHNEHPRCII